jgi:hypothetical protein
MLSLLSSFPIPICSSVFPTASCSCFKVLGLILRSLIHSEMILVQGEKKGSDFSLLHVFPTTFVEEAVFSPSCVLGSFVEDQLTIAVWVHVWIIILIHWSSCLFLCENHTVFIVTAL